jgi:bifunctional DNA-binding transcriptional regulator/antitoxin component of YhaV-PrlF toxin-antitoxin module
MDRFEATLGEGEDAPPLVEVPFDVKERFGKARAPVRLVVNGVELRTTVAVYGGRSYVGFRKEIRERAGIAPGDRVTIEIEADDAPREVELPPELSHALDEHPDAKKQETRARRIDRAVEMLRDGVKHP